MFERTVSPTCFLFILWIVHIMILHNRYNLIQFLLESTEKELTSHIKSGTFAYILTRLFRLCRSSTSWAVLSVAEPTFLISLPSSVILPNTRYHPLRLRFTSISFSCSSSTCLINSLSSSYFSPPCKVIYRALHAYRCHTLNLIDHVFAELLQVLSLELLLHILSSKTSNW